MKLKKAITHLKLSQANRGKLNKLTHLATEYIRVVQAFVDHIYDHKATNKYADLPPIETKLSQRWKRCAWMQACGIMESFFSNGREKKPVLKSVCIQANSNVVVIEKPTHSRYPFDFWLRISTLDKGSPIRIPIRLYKNARKELFLRCRLGQASGKLSSGVTLNCDAKGGWFATFCIETEVEKAPPSTEVIGADAGIVNTLTSSNGKRYGQFSNRLKKKTALDLERRRRRQKLNSCLTKKSKPTVSLVSRSVSSFVKNEIGRAINQFLKELPQGATVALERLSVKSMRFKSRQMNRILSASQLGFLAKRLRFKLDQQGVRYRSVQAAYSSQECPECRFTFKLNRPARDKFLCLWCGYSCEADESASRVIAKRLGDEEINGLSDYRQVETVLVKRFLGRLPDARSVSGRLDTQQRIMVIMVIPPSHCSACSQLP
jgi:putative transposase